MLFMPLTMILTRNNWGRYSQGTNPVPIADWKYWPPLIWHQVLAQRTQKIKMLFRLPHVKLSIIKLSPVITRLVFCKLLDFRGNHEKLKKNRLEKLVSPMKWSTWLYTSKFQNVAMWRFFDINEVLYFHEKDMVKRGRQWEKCFKNKSLSVT